MNWPRTFGTSAVCALDFGAGVVTAAVADKNNRGQTRVLGIGESRALGVECGKILNLPDAVESVLEASRSAFHSAGVHPRQVYYNYDDPLIEHRRPVGSRLLDGEGEIQESDLVDAAQSARRLVGNYETTVLYAKQTQFIVDDKDAVAVPLGIFGHKVSLTLETLLARTAHFDRWQKIMRRAGFSLSCPILSGWSSAVAVLSVEERKSLKIVWDLGSDLLTGVVYGDNKIRAYRVIANDISLWGQSSSVVLAVTQSLQQMFGGVSEVVCTGDLSGDTNLISALAEGTGLGVRRALPQGLAEIDRGSQASLAGLVLLAMDMKVKSMIARPTKGMLAGAKKKAESFLNDYF